MIETQEMIAILALVIVAVFVIVVGFDCIKDGMCDIGELPGEEQGKNGQEFDERAAETFFHEHRRKAHCRGVGKSSGRICEVSMSAG